MTGPIRQGSAGAHEGLHHEVGGHQALYDELISVIGTATGTTAEVLAALLAVLARGIGFDLAVAWRWHAGQDLLRPAEVWQEAGGGFDEFVAATRQAALRPGEAIPGLVVASGEPLWAGDMAEHPASHGRPSAAEAGLRVAFAFPVRANDRLVGVIELYGRQSQAPEASLLDTATRVGTRLGPFIERLELEAHRAELLDQLEQSRRRQAFLLHVNRLLAGSRSLAETVRRLARAAVPALGDLCLIDIVDGEGALQRLAAQHADPRRQRFADELLQYPPDPEGAHPAAEAVRTGRFMLASAMSQDFLRDTTINARHLELTEQLEFTSFLSVPIRVADRTIGAITVVSAGSGQVFGGDDLELVGDLADQVAWALDRAQRDDEQREVSRHLQQSLLPEKLEHVPGVEAAARYVATDVAVDVGGDFYDLVALGDDRLVAVIGDVEGHDMTAAAVMGRVRNALLAYLEIDDDPANLLHLLDRFVQRHAGGRLATLCIALLEPSEGTVAVASAGHPRPLVAGPDSPCALVPLQVGPPLGFGVAQRPAERFPLPPGSALLLYTDGLTEHRSIGPDAHLQEVSDALDRVWSADTESVCDAILAVVDGCEHDDDVALLALKRV